MQDAILTQTLFTSPKATADFARTLAPFLEPGDTILLDGPIGAGKSHFARALIQGRLEVADRLEDVPSPTFTLVQTYDDGGAEIWHSDLYRLGNVAEIDELGLWDAFETAICLVEWPDRMGALAPKAALTISLSPTTTEGQRIAQFKYTTPTWQAKLSRAGLSNGDARINTFLTAAGWDQATRTPLAGDASTRRYDRLTNPATGQTAILMDTPPESIDTVTAFTQVARHLEDLGFSAPTILYVDQPNGLLLLEDLGDALFARLSQTRPQTTHELSEAAVDFLVDLHRYPPPPEFAAKNAGEMAAMITVVFDYYAPNTPQKTQKHILDLLEAALHALRPFAPVLALRDFHAENLIWLPNREGTKRVGLLDFQDAFICHPAYDLISYTRDARRDVPDTQAQHLAQRYISKTGQEKTAFLAAAAVIAVQRNLRILGIFARLALRDGKPGYIDLITRVWGYLCADLAHCDLAELRKAILSALPEPSEKFLQELREKCQTNQMQ